MAIQSGLPDGSGCEPDRYVPELAGGGNEPERCEPGRWLRLAVRT